MTNKEFLSVCPHREVSKLLQLRGITQKKAAQKTGISYFSLANFLSKGEYQTVAGRVKPYLVPHVRKALAEILNIPYDDLWGPNGKAIINQLIGEEISKRKPKKTHDSRKYRWRLRAFLKNLIRLGYVPVNEK